ncbi:PqqD family peptide modification chaperone [Baia soyae]|uniref:Coenzyme PQQ synthesis protein D (PqqD) n=1 Tax=Baia soyae TaxID=1544746 RepID=A0A4R2RU65_9BACL|nr:PqqD family peptide modification chaperone [Baia soyae]TCP66449.1 hypothetical protein EDD57_12428 [Baia soyae]
MKLALPDHVQISEVDGKYVLLDCRGNFFYTVSQSGAEFIEQVRQHGDMRRAIEKISMDHLVLFERVQDEMTSFADHLIQKGLLIKT